MAANSEAEGSPYIMVVASPDVAAMMASLTQTSAAANAMWAWDTAWAGGSHFVDASICIAGTPRPYDETCGGSAFCTWGFWKASLPCSLETFEKVMFQSTRYIWCQTQLANLLANKPPYDYRDPVAWAQWCLDIMRLISCARYATNISAKYQPKWCFFTQREYDLRARNLRYALDGTLGPNAQATYDELLDDLRLRASATGDTPRHLLSMFQPKDHNLISLHNRSESPPTQKTHFDPVIAVKLYDPNYEFGTTRQGGLLGEKWGYPMTRSGEYHDGSPMYERYRGGASVFEAMSAWFRASFAHGGNWIKASNVPTTITRDNRPVFIGEDEITVTHSRSDLWYGSAYALMRMCEAWAQDVVAESFGTVVSRGFSLYLDHMESIPAGNRLNGMSDQDIAVYRDAITQRVADETAAMIGLVGGSIGAIAAAVAPVAGVILAVATLLAQAFTWILEATGNMAVGGATLKCPDSPLVRMMLDDGSAACDFDTRAGREDSAERQETVTAKTNLIVDVIESGVEDTDVWYDAASVAEGGEGSILPVTAPPPAEETTATPWAPYLVAGGIIIGGVALLKYMRDR